MADYERIYREQAREYEAMVAAEDADGNLLPAIRRRAKVDGAAILEVGVGTGRLTRLLAPHAERYVGFEREAAMVALAEPAIAGHANARVGVGDARALPPIERATFDLAIAGWVFGHFRSWYPDAWKTEIAIGLEAMRAALRPGGTLVIIETLGTGATDPAPPKPELAEYYAWLEQTHGMQRDAVRTDYQFQSAEDAAEKMSFFFGRPFADRVRALGSPRVPECTGIWSAVIPRPPTSAIRQHQ